MPGSRLPYPPEFRQQILELVRAGRSPEELAREYEPTAQTIRNWVTQGDRDAGRRQDGLTTQEREELRGLFINLCGFGSVRAPRVSYRDRRDGNRSHP